MADKIKGLPKKFRPLRGRGALPALKNLMNKSPEDLVRTLGRFGLEPDMDALAKRANRAFERMDKILDAGLLPDPETWDMVDKSVEREMTGYLRQQVKAAIRNYRTHRASLASDKFMWLTVGDEAVCSSCEPRHGEVKTMKQWQQAGVPGSANLKCGDECRCSLQPEIEEDSDGEV